jgi:predicted Zn-dependent protease
MRILLAMLVGMVMGVSSMADARPIRSNHGDSYYQTPVTYQSYERARHAKKTYRHYSYNRHNVRRYYGTRHYARTRYSQRRVYHRGYARANYSHRRRYADGRPRAWCGWYMRQIKGVGNSAYNLARNWARWGRPSTPHQGAVVVWPHHVGLIVGPCGNGRCVVKSGNYNNRVAVVSMNVRNAIAFRE